MRLFLRKSHAVSVSTERGGSENAVRLRTEQELAAGNERMRLWSFATKTEKSANDGDAETEENFSPGSGENNICNPLHFQGTMLLQWFGSEENA